MNRATSKVLIVEDTLSVGLLHEQWIEHAGFEVERVDNGREALRHLRAETVKVVLLDLQLPDVSGMDIMATIQREQIPVTVVVVTSQGSIKTAVDVMKAGAYDYIVKPAAKERLITTTKNAFERETLQETVKEITRPYAKANLQGFVGSSLPMVAVYRMVEAVGRSAASVFITGESGTGKEVCAQAIHRSSARKNKPFIALNCAAIPKDLIESEIFGHLKGAFTGATTSRDGAALAANGGTLFLDEICEMDLALQSKLLRFLQNGMVQKVGSDKIEKVDVRILCATNRDPEREVEEGSFREDLFYRLHVVPIHLPPLRERDRDVIEIANALLETMTAEEDKEFTSISKQAQSLLLAHDWPGNVRELQNVMRNAIILNEGETIEPEMFIFSGSKRNSFAQSASSGNESSRSQFSIELGRSFDEIERDVVEATIGHCDGSIPKAAEVLQLSPSTLYRKREGWSELSLRS